jgi:hypothetical protein
MHMILLIIIIIWFYHGDYKIYLYHYHYRLHMIKYLANDKKMLINDRIISFLPIKLCMTI